MGLFTGLLDDAALIIPGATDTPATVVERHRALRTEHPDLIATVLVHDRSAVELDRAAGDLGTGEPLPVTVINTTGAGGLASLADRSFDRLRPVAVDSPLRDPGDLVANLARVASAARALEPEITVRVGIPYGFGWSEAIAEAEAEGLQGLLDLDQPTDRVAEQLSAYVEADLGFATGAVNDGPGWPQLITALDALIDGAPIDRATQLLQTPDHDAAKLIMEYDQPRIDRIRRRLTALRCPDPAAVIDELPAQGRG